MRRQPLAICLGVLSWLCLSATAWGQATTQQEASHAASGQTASCVRDELDDGAPMCATSKAAFCPNAVKKVCDVGRFLSRKDINEGIKWTSVTLLSLKTVLGAYLMRSEQARKIARRLEKAKGTAKNLRRLKLFHFLRAMTPIFNMNTKILKRLGDQKNAIHKFHHMVAVVGTGWSGLNAVATIYRSYTMTVCKDVTVLGKRFYGCYCALRQRGVSMDPIEMDRPVDGLPKRDAERFDPDKPTACLSTGVKLMRQKMQCSLLKRVASGYLNNQSPRSLVPLGAS